VLETNNIPELLDRLIEEYRDLKASIDRSIVLHKQYGNDCLDTFYYAPKSAINKSKRRNVTKTLREERKLLKREKAQVVYYLAIYRKIKKAKAMFNQPMEGNYEQENRRCANG